MAIGARGQRRRRHAADSVRSSFLIGPVDVEGRPIVKIKEVAFDPKEKAFTLSFEQGGSATVKMAKVDANIHALDVVLDRPVAGKAVCRDPLHVLTEFNNDVARVAVREKGARSWREDTIMGSSAPRPPISGRAASRHPGTTRPRPIWSSTASRSDAARLRGRVYTAFSSAAPGPAAGAARRSWRSRSGPAAAGEAAFARHVGHQAAQEREQQERAVDVEELGRGSRPACSRSGRRRRMKSRDRRYADLVLGLGVEIDHRLVGDSFSFEMVTPTSTLIEGLSPWFCSRRCTFGFSNERSLMYCPAMRTMISAGLIFASAMSGSSFVSAACSAG